jgi:hypothetical protein
MGWLKYILEAVLGVLFGEVRQGIETQRREGDLRADGARQGELQNAQEALSDAEKARAIEDRSRTLSDSDLVDRM